MDRGRSPQTGIRELTKRIMPNIQDSIRESYNTTPAQRMDLLEGAHTPTSGAIGDVDSESYNASVPMAKKRIIL